MKVIVGLGNPGRQYARTPHNVGFMVADAVAERLSATFRGSLRFDAQLAEGTWGGERLLLVKPQTYMNNSGTAVATVLRYRGVEPANLVVVLDDADLPAGRLRIRAAGSSGGHRGLASVIDHVGTDAFPRVRIGIGRAPAGGGLVDQVLRSLSEAERESLEPIVGRAADAALCIVDSGVDAAMNRFNAPPPEPAAAKDAAEP